MYFSLNVNLLVTQTLTVVWKSALRLHINDRGHFSSLLKIADEGCGVLAPPRGHSDQISQENTNTVAI